MKIIPNIPQAVKLIKAFKLFSRNREEIFKYRACEDFEEERKYLLKSTSDWGKGVCELLGIEIEVSGYENLPEKGPVLFVSNHQGYADIACHCAVLDKFQFAFVAKKELEKIPLYGQGIKDIRSIMLDRDDARGAVKTINEGINLIDKGFSLLIFPEGTRSKSHEMAEFKKGSLRLATKPKVPVVPITLDGTYKVFEETGVISPAKIKYIIHPMIETKDMDRKEAAGLAQIVEEIVRKDL